MSSALFQGRTAILLLTTAAAIQSAQTAHNEAKNLAELNAICQLIKLATGGPPNVRPAVVDESAISDIGTFNISLADPEWSIQFPTDAAKTEDDAKNCPANEHQAKCKKQWLEWQKSKLRTKAPDSVFTRLPINDAKKRRPQGRAAAQAVAGILAEAQELKDSFEKEHSKSTTQLADDALKELRKAAFNFETAVPAANERCNINGGASRGAACALPTVGQGLCLAALCLCAKGDSQPTQEHCGGSINPTMTAWAATNVKAGYATISAACDKAPARPFTATALRQMLAQLHSQAKTISAAGGSIIAIGTVDTTADCDARANVACIDLKKASPYDTAAAAQEIGWERHIESAAANIEKANSVAAAAAELNRKLKALQKKAEIIYKQLYHSRDEEKSSETSPKTVTEGKAKTEKVCNEAGNDEDKCNELKEQGCVFDDTAKKCELKKEVKEKLEKGSQEGRDDKKEDKCAGKQQKDCEKATECKWENNACKDSSFLVKKQIDLIASTFASLVAL